MDPKHLFRPLGALAAAGLMLTTAACGGNGAKAATSGGAYKAGRYEATGSYTDPGGSDSIVVDATLTAAGEISAVKVTPLADDSPCKKFQREFAAGIDAVVVGRKISGLKVAKVSGSSLTGNGFNAAMAKIAGKARR